ARSPMILNLSKSSTPAKGRNLRPLVVSLRKAIRAEQTPLGHDRPVLVYGNDE
ncbi:unnamed protein product, partial [marine sediment metagenome]